MGKPYHGVCYASHVRKLLVIAMLAACSHPAGPKWPQRETPAVDGGESLAPHMARSIAAAAVEEDKPIAPPPAAISITPLVTDPTAVTPAVTPPASDEPVTTEQEIVIEIHEDD
jgi:hypothetical protein